MDVRDKVVLVTGGASGIGFATAELLTTNGARLVLADHDRATGERASATLGAVFMHLDVRDPAQWRDVCERVARDHGRLDVVYLNAGVNCPSRSIAEVSVEDLTRTVETNLYGIVYGVHSCLRLLEANGGAIVVTASIAGLRRSEADPIYAMTKHGVIGLMRSLATQLAERNITINAVCPTVTDTPMVRGNAEFRREFEPLGIPMLEPAAVAHAVLGILASGATGQAVVCRPGHVPTAWPFPAPDESATEPLPRPV